MDNQQRFTMHQNGWVKEDVIIKDLGKKVRFIINLATLLIFVIPIAYILFH